MTDLNIRTHGSPAGRLSSTQRLVGRGMTILAGSVALAGILGAAQRADNGAVHFYGTVSLAGLQVSSERSES
jgi:hypothetical protein